MTLSPQLPEDLTEHNTPTVPNIQCLQITVTDALVITSLQPSTISS
jgi:hypothetical protein